MAFQAALAPILAKLGIGGAGAAGAGAGAGLGGGAGVGAGLGGGAAAGGGNPLLAALIGAGAQGGQQKPKHMMDSIYTDYTGGY